MLKKTTRNKIVINNFPINSIVQLTTSENDFIIYNENDDNILSVTYYVTVTHCQFE